MSEPTVQALFSVPQIIALLHPQPETWSVPSELADSERHLGRDRVCAGQHTVKLLARYPEPSRRLTDG